VTRGWEVVELYIVSIIKLVNIKLSQDAQKMRKHSSGQNE
jgi:hypothetical protein